MCTECTQSLLASQSVLLASYSKWGQKTYIAISQILKVIAPREEVFQPLITRAAGAQGSTDTKGARKRSRPDCPVTPPPPIHVTPASTDDI